MAFSKFLAAAGLAVTLAGPATADTGLTQLQLSVARILPTYGYHNVDVKKLNTSQLAQIKHLAHSNRGQGHIRGSIGAVIRNRIVNFLRS